MVGANSFAQEVVHFRNALDTGKSAACDHEGKKSSAALRIALRFRFLQHSHELVAQIKCVAKILERTGMFAHSRNLRVIQPVPMAMTNWS